MNGIKLLWFILSLVRSHALAVMEAKYRAAALATNILVQKVIETSRQNIDTTAKMDIEDRTHSRRVKKMPKEIRKTRIFTHTHKKLLFFFFFF